jgi:multiple sugar transport system ATP-binding protein
MTLGDRIVLMNHGVIQQVDAPMEIYRRPANRFVASFIGSPAMNFIAGEVHHGMFRFALGDSNSEGAAVTAFREMQVGDDVPNGSAILGVRPEDLLARDGGQPIGTVTLDVVEHMGHETIAHFQLSGNDHVARFAPDVRVEPGNQLEISIRPGTYHLFTADDGRRLN